MKPPARSGRQAPPRYRFAPDVVRGEDPAAVSARFQAEATEFGLVWTCRDCALALRDGRCSVGWPNGRLQWQGEQPPAVLVELEPAFCKAFEPLFS